MVSVYGFTPTLISDVLDRLRQQTAGCIGANFIMLFVQPDQAHECVAAAASKVRVVDFFYTDPDATLVEIVHDHGALACWQVGSKEEAAAAVAAGCDFIIAQGIEAGGHVRGRTGLLSLLSEVLDTVDVPVLAAGGIGTGRAMAAALAAGADGVRVGTRFLAAEETEAHPAYVNALIEARPQDTVSPKHFGSAGRSMRHIACYARVCRPPKPSRERLSVRALTCIQANGILLGVSRRTPYTRAIQEPLKRCRCGLGSLSVG